MTPTRHWLVALLLPETASAQVWRSAWSPTHHRLYYYDPASGQVSWTLPSGATLDTRDAAFSSQVWRCAWSPQHQRQYFYDPILRSAAWTVPPGFIVNTRDPVARRAAQPHQEAFSSGEGQAEPSGLLPLPADLPVAAASAASLAPARTPRPHYVDNQRHSEAQADLPAGERVPPRPMTPWPPWHEVSKDMIAATERQRDMLERGIVDAAVQTDDAPAADTATHAQDVEGNSMTIGTETAASRPPPAAPQPLQGLNDATAGEAGETSTEHRGSQGAPAIQRAPSAVSISSGASSKRAWASSEDEQAESTHIRPIDAPSSTYTAD